MYPVAPVRRTRVVGMANVPIGRVGVASQATCGGYDHAALPGATVEHEPTRWL